MKKTTTKTKPVTKHDRQPKSASKKQIATAKKVAPSKKSGRSSSKHESVTKVSPAKAREMMQKLCDLYPDASCELKFATPFQLLIATILSAQTTDVAVNKCTKTLFDEFPNAKALAEADLDRVKEIIKPTGYYNAKATNIQNCARKLVEKFKGDVPKTQEELTMLPGVGVKTANVVLGEAFGIPGWTVDTHVQRLSKRLGLTTNSDPLKIESDLQKLFPKDDWSKDSITLIWHGRRMCFAKKPACEQCPINRLCPSSLVV
jgi:endonuclease-3